ncbi:uncharacterized protein CC84DRAFT_129545 [Paraphaeosphaeria sporulosa]|uniref:Uncharacterized protein n=1 Tax=Paraphaeosphaeria sporulosa TaxID=1460663 RepID=A0A177CYJ8_9PLEO|nr:uncharacterized protein CC84DRAFT_129545 [Paraphaeosphaeria sporulosa]OAG12593.1 hypothetical protein CC84DRAFT_129545 [Paraphaeosphaeria sporulosa]
MVRALGPHASISRCTCNKWMPTVPHPRWLRYCNSFSAASSQPRLRRGCSSIGSNLPNANAKCKYAIVRTDLAHQAPKVPDAPRSKCNVCCRSITDATDFCPMCLLIIALIDLSRGPFMPADATSVQDPPWSRPPNESILAGLQYLRRTCQPRKLKFPKPISMARNMSS